jgi:hypothetical protein
MSEQRVIIAGCGGGYDIFGGLPLYYQLHTHAKIILTNWSFTSINTLLKYSIEVAPALFKVEYDPLWDSIIIGNDVYFPEWHLSKQINQPIFAIADPESINQIIEAYRYLINVNSLISSIYLVDGGCDVILSGVEKELATPVEDMMHLIAIQSLPISNKYVQIIGANADMGDGVIQSDIDQRLYQLSETRVGDSHQKILIKQEVWDLKQPEVQYYAKILTQCQPERSIVQSLILATLEGHEGLYTPSQLIPRIGTSVVPLSVQTRTQYTFNLSQLSSTILYLPLIDLYMNSDQIDVIIENFHNMISDLQTKTQNEISDYCPEMIFKAVTTNPSK